MSDINYTVHLLDSGEITVRGTVTDPAGTTWTSTDTASAGEVYALRNAGQVGERIAAAKGRIEYILTELQDAGSRV